MQDYKWAKKFKENIQKLSTELYLDEHDLSLFVRIWDENVKQKITLLKSEFQRKFTRIYEKNLNWDKSF